MSESSHTLKVWPVKVWPEFFKAIDNGTKTFEYCVDDGDLQPNDLVVFAEYDINTKQYTGADIIAKITYLLRGSDCCDFPDGYCIFSFKILGG